MRIELTLAEARELLATPRLDLANLGPVLVGEYQRLLAAGDLKGLVSLAEFLMESGSLISNTLIAAMKPATATEKGEVTNVNPSA